MEASGSRIFDLFQKIFKRKNSVLMVYSVRNAGEKKRLERENGKLATVLEEFQSMFLPR